MKRMHALEKAAMVTGFLSLVGLCSIVYYHFSTDVSTPTYSTVSTINNAASPATKEAAKETVSPSFAPSQDVLKSEDLVEQRPVQPSAATMRKIMKAIPAFTTIRQTTAAYPTLRKEAIKQQRILEKLQEEEWKKMEAQESTTIIETEPPADEAPVRTIPAEPAQVENKRVTAKTEAEPPPPKVAKKPLTAEAEKSILEEANKASASNIDRKQQSKQAGKMQVREMRQRPDGTLTTNELEGVFARIVTEKGEQDSDASCVHIQSLPDTEKAATQIGIYLRQKGFIMAGRGEAPANARGIQVDASGKCITVVVGRT